MTTTTKYELTDDDIDQLWRKMFNWHNNVPPNRDVNRVNVRDWFATLPVVSREAADRALGEATEAEADQYSEDYANYDDEIFESYRYALDRFLARRRAMLDDATGEPPKVDPTPAPQPAIAVVAELAELRKNADRCLATLGAHRSQLDDTIATIGLMLESQDAQRDVNKIHAQRLDTLNLRVTDLEFVAQRRPWWRWW